MKKSLEIGMAKATEIAPGEMFEGVSYRQTGNGTINKASQIILARESGELSVVDRKLFNYLINRSYRSLKNDEVRHRIPVKEALGFLGHSSTDRLQECLKRLGSVSIDIDYKDPNGTQHSVKAHYLSYDLSHTEDGWLHFAFDSILIGFLNNPKIFATLSLADIRRFKSTYSAKLYEVMSLYVNRQHPIWTPTIEEFREVMGVTDQYPRFDNLKSRVIIAAVEEVNDVANFIVTWEPVRTGQGGKTTALQFEAMHRKAESIADMRLLNNPIGRGKTERDPNTVDLLDGQTDAERDPLEVTPAAHKRAISMLSDTLGEDVALDPYLQQWRESMHGRRVRDANRSFLNWLDIKLTKESSEELDIVDEQTLSSLVEAWAGE